MLLYWSILVVCLDLCLSEEWKDLTCHPNITYGSLDTDLPLISVNIDRMHSSRFNGIPYTSAPKFITTLTLGGNVSTGSVDVEASRGNVLKLTVGYNGSHVCAASQFRIEKDTCWMFYAPNCSGKLSICDSECFPANNYYKQYAILIYHGLTASASIGQWTMTDMVYLHTAPAKQVTCFYKADGYDLIDPSSNASVDPQLTQVLCPIGQRCRVSIGRRYSSDPWPKVYVGCEKDLKHYDSCPKQCSYQEQSPTTRYQERWDKMCKYCCNEDLCNSPTKCNNKLECAFNQHDKQ